MKFAHRSELSGSLSDSPFFFYSSHTPQSLPHYPAMFQRTIFRQAQAARSALTPSASKTLTPLALRRTSLLQTQLPTVTRPFARQPARRFYSTEGEQKDAVKEGEAPKEGEAVNEDPMQKELEEKNKEILELKVSYARPVHRVYSYSRLTRAP